MELNEITKAHAAVLLRLCVEQADQFDCWPRKQAGSPDFDPELFERQIRTIADEGVSARAQREYLRELGFVDREIEDLESEVRRER